MDRPRKKVLIVNLDRDIDKACNLFIESILKSFIREKYDIHLALSDRSYVWPIAEQLGVPCHFIDLPGRAGMLRKKLVVIRSLQRIYSEERFDVIHTNSSLDHVAACWWRLIYKPLILVIRTRYSPEVIKDTAINRLIHNNLTSVNIIFDSKAAEALRRKAAGLLRLDNPTVLQDSPSLSKRGLEMLEYCYLSMTSPTRDHTLSRKITDWSHIELSYVIHFYFNQGDASPLLDLLRHYQGYDPEVLDRIHFIIIDDGSHIEIEIPDMHLNFTWLRITEDIPWNQGGARNLGAVYSKSDKIILSDLDIEFPEETLCAIIKAPACGRDFYKFHMKEPGTGKLGRGHPNTFLISRARFLRFGGYDEEFSGHYGAEDFRFVKFQKAQGSRQRYFNAKYICNRRSNINRNLHYHNLERDLSFNTPVDARKRFEIAEFGHNAGHTRMFLNFSWKKIYERSREVEYKRGRDRKWRYLQHWRWLAGSR